MKQERPLLIVTSCTRNYGWVTRAFLEGNTRWADYIVIVDQMSTDATRPLIKEYNALHSEELRVKSEECIHRAEIVIVDDPDMTYKENIRAKMAFMKGRELAAGRDAIYFALDIDEVMPANWMQTEDGKKILSSKPGDMFQLEWANIMPDGKTCDMNLWQYKIFHDNGMDWQDTTIQMHTPLLPYSDWDLEPTKLNDFPLLHFGEYFEKWIQYKRKYYQFLDIQQKRSKSAITIFRRYYRDAVNTYEGAKKIQPIRKEWLFEDVDIISMIDTSSTPIFVPYVKEIIEKEGIEKYISLDVWSEEFSKDLGISDPRPIRWKLLHSYLRLTRKKTKNIVVRGIDFILKKIC